MHLRRSLALLLPFLACSGGDIEPTEGTWTYNGSMVVTNTCLDGEPPTDIDGNFELIVTGPGKFTVDEDGNDPFDCTHDGATFNCPERLDDTLTYAGLDAEVSVRVSVSGDIEAPNSVSGTQTVNLSCEGSSCAELAALGGYKMVPCSYSYSFTAAI